MTTCIHLSDLHFGPRFVPHLGQVILKEISEKSPDAVIISGDFTLRARPAEYEAAQIFVRQIKVPLLTIPGNHDQPLYAPFERLFSPYRRYQKYICPILDSLLSVPGLHIVGLSDCQPILPGGFWSREQRKWIQEQLAAAPPDAAKIIVSHHQFLWGGKWRPAGFWYPTPALEWLSGQGVDLVLNGHTHVPTAELTPQGVIVARAGTATSERLRHGWGNTYNVIEIEPQRISICVRQYKEQLDAYVETKSFIFPRREQRT